MDGSKDNACISETFDLFFGWWNVTCHITKTTFYQ
jgi:hypothetical protein